MALRGIIFDKDGTLFDYFSVWGPVMRNYTDEMLKLLDRQDSPVLRTRFLRLLGVGEEKMHAEGLVFRSSKLFMIIRLYLFCRMHRLPFRRLAGYIKAGFMDAHRHMQESLLGIQSPLPVADLFGRLKAHDYRIGIVTSDTAESTRICLDHLEINQFIDFVSTYDDHLAHKPNPEAVTVFCSRFSLEPSEVAVVGDSPVDMKFARKGGAGYVIAVLTGSNDRRRLGRHADVIYDDLEQLLHDRRLFPDVRELSRDFS